MERKNIVAHNLMFVLFQCYPCVFCYIHIYCLKQALVLNVMVFFLFFFQIFISKNTTITIALNSWIIIIISCDYCGTPASCYSLTFSSSFFLVLTLIFLMVMRMRMKMMRMPMPYTDVVSIVCNISRSFCMYMSIIIILFG